MFTPDTEKRVTLFAGHYGSGKTNIAVNYAVALSKLGKSVTIADLDIVNPYFRTKDSEKLFRKNGIELVSSEFANSNVDLPALPQELYGVVQRRERHAVMDIGGDDRGAYALGRYTPYILEENSYEMIFVMNFYRPLTRTAEEAFEVMREIEVAGGIPFTALVNNSNVGADTSPADIEETFRRADELSRMSGLPVIMTTAEAGIADKVNADNVFPLVLQEKIF